MIGGLAIKIGREVWLGTVLFALALAIVERALLLILPQVMEGFGDVWLDVPFVRAMAVALLGTELDGQITARLMQAILWVHPVVLSIVWAHEIIHCSRMPAGEIDRGTIDVLLGLPVSRRVVFLAESAAWMLSGLCILAVGSLGYFWGAGELQPDQRPPVVSVLLVLVNLYCVYLAVGGVAYLVSAMSNRRGRAVAIVFALVLASFLLNFLAQFWTPAQRISFLGVLNYYQPAAILSEGTAPMADLVVLLAVGLLTWIVAGEIIARRSICTV